jgi:phage terminase large subunit GpA-like protein
MRKPSSLATWIERNIVLPEGFTAAPGAMKLYPYQAAIADALGDPSVERVTFQKAARIGWTSLLNATIAFWCAEAPGPILMLLPTESDARDHIVSDLEPLFAASPKLAGIFAADNVGQRGRPTKGLPQRNTILSRRFTGGSLKIVAAKAPRNLRRHTAKYLVIDESDAMKSSGEGSVLALAEKRTLTFVNRKIIFGSTPVDEETSYVCRAYEASDQRIFEVPCPKCGVFTEILWQHIEWEPDLPATASYRCPHCNGLIPEKHKPQMLRRGRWRALRPEVDDNAGFRLNSLVSPLATASWGKLAAEFLAAKNDPATLKPFVNTVLGQAWRQLGDELDENALKTGDFSLEKIPAEVMMLTAFCDVQADRLEITHCGWTKTSGECFVLAHTILYGPTTGEAVWRDLSDMLLQRFPHPLGGTLAIDAAGVDAGDGGMFDTVMRFCAPRAGRRVFATKGVPGFARPAFKVSQTLKIRGSERLYLLGVDSLKAVIFERLKRGQSIKFSDTLDATYFEQLASERLVTKFSRGARSRCSSPFPAGETRRWIVSWETMASGKDSRSTSPRARQH